MSVPATQDEPSSQPGSTLDKADRRTPWGAIVGLFICWIAGTVLSYLTLLLTFFGFVGWDTPTVGEAQQKYALALFVSYALGALLGAIAIIVAQPFSRRLYLIAVTTALISAVATGYATHANAMKYIETFWPAPVPGVVAGVVMCAVLVGRERWIWGGRRVLALSQEGMTLTGARMASGRPNLAWASACVFLFGYLTIWVSTTPESLLVALTAGLVSVFLAFRGFPNLLAIVTAIMSIALVIAVLSGL
jgi:hypothetical protein